MAEESNAKNYDLNLTHGDFAYSIKYDPELFGNDGGVKMFLDRPEESADGNGLVYNALQSLSSEEATNPNAEHVSNAYEVLKLQETTITQHAQAFFTDYLDSGIDRNIKAGHDSISISDLEKVRNGLVEKLQEGTQEGVGAIDFTANKIYLEAFYDALGDLSTYTDIGLINNKDEDIGNIQVIGYGDISPRELKEFRDTYEAADRALMQQTPKETLQNTTQAPVTKADERVGNILGFDYQQAENEPSQELYINYLDALYWGSDDGLSLTDINGRDFNLIEDGFDYATGTEIESPMAFLKDNETQIIDRFSKFLFEYADSGIDDGVFSAGGNDEITLIDLVHISNGFADKMDENAGEVDNLLNAHGMAAFYKYLETIPTHALNQSEEMQRSPTNAGTINKAALDDFIAQHKERDLNRVNEIRAQNGLEALEGSPPAQKAEAQRYSQNPYEDLNKYLGSDPKDAEPENPTDSLDQETPNSDESDKLNKQSLEEIESGKEPSIESGEELDKYEKAASENAAPETPEEVEVTRKKIDGLLDQAESYCKDADEIIKGIKDSDGNNLTKEEVDALDEANLDLSNIRYLIISIEEHCRNEGITIEEDLAKRIEELEKRADNIESALEQKKIDQAPANDGQKVEQESENPTDEAKPKGEVLDGNEADQAPNKTDSLDEQRQEQEQMRQEGASESLDLDQTQERPNSLDEQRQEQLDMRKDGANEPKDSSELNKQSPVETPEQSEAGIETPDTSTLPPSELIKDMQRYAHFAQKGDLKALVHEDISIIDGRAGPKTGNSICAMLDKDPSELGTEATALAALGGELASNSEFRAAILKGLAKEIENGMTADAEIFMKRHNITMDDIENRQEFDYVKDNENYAISMEGIEVDIPTTAHSDMNTGINAGSTDLPELTGHLLIDTFETMQNNGQGDAMLQMLMISAHDGGYEKINDAALKELQVNLSPVDNDFGPQSRVVMAQILDLSVDEVSKMTPRQMMEKIVSICESDPSLLDALKKGFEQNADAFANAIVRLDQKQDGATVTKKPALSLNFDDKASSNETPSEGIKPDDKVEIGDGMDKGSEVPIRGIVL